MSHYAGIDLHSNNLVLGVKDESGRKVFGERLPNDLSWVLDRLERFRPCKVAVESTFNWYWLVDGLMENGYDTRLANPAAITQYNGLKVADDHTDAVFLSELLRLQILPQGYIHPKEDRAIRDLVRRRMMLVQQRTAHLLSFKGLLARETGATIKAHDVEKLSVEDVCDMYDDPHKIMMGQVNIAAMHFLNEQITAVEDVVCGSVELRREFVQLKSVPGIGPILSLVIMLETGDIARFKKPGNYASYCRCVKAEHTTNGKVKRRNNSKNGNKYLSWAFVEAAHHSLRASQSARAYYQRKKSKRNGAVATKSLAAKLCKACYFIMRDQVPFNPVKCFGGTSGNQ